jgi:ferritin
MKTNRLSDQLTEALNAQMTKEAHASQIYLSYASWADNNGYSGISNFLFRHAAEERDHMMKLFEYILKRGLGYMEFLTMVCERTNRRRKSCDEFTG